jgi:O-antigen chain-terminating methyltransferase
VDCSPRLRSIRRRLRAPAGTERQIEIPWATARYRDERRVLDVGTAYAEPDWLDALSLLEIPELVGVDAARPIQEPAPPFEVVQADVRRLPFPTGSFELIFCISTLEHIGRDNTIYGLEAEHDEGAMLAALRELGRVLTPRGRLLVTVPCGELEDHGWFVQQPVKDWLALFGEAGLPHRAEVYELGAKGWRRTRRLRERGVRYGARGPAASAVLCAELRSA